MGPEAVVLTDFQSGPRRDTHKGSLRNASVLPMPGAPFPACPAALSGLVPALHWVIREACLAAHLITACCLGRQARQPRDTWVVALLGQEVAYAAAQGHMAFQVFYVWGTAALGSYAQRWEGGMGGEVSSCCWTCTH